MEEVMTAVKDSGKAQDRHPKTHILSLGSKEVFNIMFQLKKDNIIEIVWNCAINVTDQDILQGNANSD